MTATVGGLLDDVHARAWDLCSRSSEAEEGVSHELLAAGYLAARQNYIAGYSGFLASYRRRLFFITSIISTG